MLAPLFVLLSRLSLRLAAVKVEKGVRSQQSARSRKKYFKDVRKPFTGRKVPFALMLCQFYSGT